MKTTRYFILDISPKDRLWLILHDSIIFKYGIFQLFKDIDAKRSRLSEVHYDKINGLITFYGLCNFIDLGKATDRKYFSIPLNDIRNYKKYILYMKMKQI